MEALLMANFIVGTALLAVHIMMFNNARRHMRRLEQLEDSEPRVQSRMMTFSELPKELQDELKKIFKEKDERPQA